MFWQHLRRSLASKHMGCDTGVSYSRLVGKLERLRTLLDERFDYFRQASMGWRAFAVFDY